MSATVAANLTDAAGAHGPAVDPAPFVHRAPDGTASLTLMIDGMHCGACIQRIEGEIGRVPGVVSARANLTTRRAIVAWRDAEAGAPADTVARDIVARLDRLGFTATPFAADAAPVADADGKRLLRALAVAGFAAANVMLLSVAVWAGAASDMGVTTRGFFHWLSALIVLPAAAYAVRPFAVPALAGLRQGRLGMDLPITVAVVLACGISLFETVRGGPHVYFDAAIMLLFLLLIGRTLDHHARAHAGRMAENLMVLRGATAIVLGEDGRQHSLAVSALKPGQRLLVPPGGRVGADGIVERGQSDVDCALVTGESVPAAVAPQGRVLAGTMNLTAPLVVRITAAGEGTVLAEIARLMEAATQTRSGYVRLADRMARAYAPVVHVAALGTFALWWGALGAPWPAALMTAVAVLIITCPCALGLAVPVVQVVANGRLLGRGVVVKAADGLERLAEADTIVFDKTGTLTSGQLNLRNKAKIDPQDIEFASSMAQASSHPLARSLVAAAPQAALAEGVREVPGCGLALSCDDGEARLGRRDWVASAAERPPADEMAASGPELWLARPGCPPVRFEFSDTLRADARKTVAALQRQGYDVRLLSGDRRTAVAALAAEVGLRHWTAELSPADKVAELERLRAAGRKVAMVGDGLNDAPALAAAHVSLSPAAAADISQAAADFVFQGAALAPVGESLRVARRARSLALQNFTLALVYNVLAVPIAVAGLVTPLIAAVCMSASSLVVTGNALRLAGRRGREARQ